MKILIGFLTFLLGSHVRARKSVIKKLRNMVQLHNDCLPLQTIVFLANYYRFSASQSEVLLRKLIQR